MNRNLVVVRAGPGSLHPNFAGGKPAERTWDLLVSRYDAVSPILFKDAWQEQVYDPDLASPALYRLLRDRVPQWAGKYDYVWLCADDIDTTAPAVNKLFEACRKYELDLAQPALGPGSEVSHDLTKCRPEFLLRYTSFVEGTCPCFSLAALQKCWQAYGENQTGYGVDYLWPKLLGPGAKLAVVDGVPVTHTRRRGSLYDAFAARGLDPTQEMHELVKKEGLTCEKRTLGFIVNHAPAEDLHAH